MLLTNEKCTSIEKIKSTFRHKINVLKNNYSVTIDDPVYVDRVAYAREVWEELHIVPWNVTYLIKSILNGFTNFLKLAFGSVDCSNTSGTSVEH